MSDQDRIKLAEAMGWRRTPCECVDGGQRHGWESPDKTLFRKTNELPDPENDANDDYAVLEWLRAEDNKPWPYMLSQLDYGTRRYKWDYQIGDYARAALKVIGTEQ